VHRRISQSDNYWSFTIIRRRFHRTYSILRSTSERSPEFDPGKIQDAQTVTRPDGGFNRSFGMNPGPPVDPRASNLTDGFAGDFAAAAAS
jgi:hypothetical protein